MVRVDVGVAIAFAIGSLLGYRYCYKGRLLVRYYMPGFLNPDVKKFKYEGQHGPGDSLVRMENELLCDAMKFDYYRALWAKIIE